MTAVLPLLPLPRTRVAIRPPPPGPAASAPARDTLSAATAHTMFAVPTPLPPPADAADKMVKVKFIVDVSKAAKSKNTNLHDATKWNGGRAAGKGLCIGGGQTGKSNKEVCEPSLLCGAAPVPRRCIVPTFRRQKFISCRSV